MFEIILKHLSGHLTGHAGCAIVDGNRIGGMQVALFDSAEEHARRANLKKLEDKRVAFAQRLAREGFAPERMLFAQTMTGGYVAVCRDGGR